MTLPFRAQDSARRFSPEHQAHAAHARHARTDAARRAFEYWLEQTWNHGTLSGGNLRRFISVLRRQIQRGDFAATYAVTPNTLCDWLRRWRKSRYQFMHSSRLPSGHPRKTAQTQAA